MNFKLLSMALQVHKRLGDLDSISTTPSGLKPRYVASLSSTVFFGVYGRVHVLLGSLLPISTCRYHSFLGPHFSFELLQPAPSWSSCLYSYPLQFIFYLVARLILLKCKDKHGMPMLKASIISHCQRNKVHIPSKCPSRPCPSLSLQAHQ